MKQIKKMSKQERIVRRRKQMLVSFLVIMALFLGALCFTINSKATECKTSYKYFKSYEVQPGDTLWSIADQNLTTEHNNREEYIMELKKINHMLDDEITAGDYLVVSYYSYELL